MNNPSSSESSLRRSIGTLALAAGIVDQRTYTALIVLAIATSVIAGVWLASMLRRDEATAAMLRANNATPARAKPADKATTNA